MLKLDAKQNIDAQETETNEMVTYIETCRAHILIFAFTLHNLYLLYPSWKNHEIAMRYFWQD